MCIRDRGHPVLPTRLAEFPDANRCRFSKGLLNCFLGVLHGTRPTTSHKPATPFYSRSSYALQTRRHPNLPKPRTLRLHSSWLLNTWVFELRLDGLIAIGTSGSPLGRTSTSAGARCPCSTPVDGFRYKVCLLYTSPSPRDRTRSRMPSSA